MSRHRPHLKALRDIALAHARGPHPDLAALARELGVVVHRDAGAIAADLANLRRTPRGLRRLLLARRGGPSPLSVLLLAWPPNHATPSHDHGGLWGLEMSLHGALEVEAWTRPATGDGWQLRGRDWLGPGDAHWFDADPPSMHRCRNLSRHEVALSLHVYGGDLADCNTYEPDARGGRWRVQPAHLRIDGALRV
jgi:predicted metal-dependent enzyme (double-stranded beta helix superfamily)